MIVSKKTILAQSNQVKSRKKKLQRSKNFLHPKSRLQKLFNISTTLTLHVTFDKHMTNMTVTSRHKNTSLYLFKFHTFKMEHYWIPQQKMLMDRPTRSSGSCTGQQMSTHNEWCRICVFRTHHYFAIKISVMRKALKRLICTDSSIVVQ